MAKMAAIVLTVVLFISLVFTIPIVLLSEEFSSYDKIDENISYYYSTSNSSATETLNLNIDRSDVEIKYVYPTSEFIVKINVNFEISGANVQGKSYLDYFNILWENGSANLNFTMEYKSGIEPLEVLSLFKNISIVVILRVDEIIDLNVEMENGLFQQVVPFMVPINNVKINNTYGTILLNFISCVISGTITAFTNRGNIELNAYNTQYTQNNIWSFFSNSGEITILITHNSQVEGLGANITSVGATNTGRIRTVYYDSIPDIGAVFTYYNTSTNDGDSEGFQLDIEHDPLYIRYTSNDFPATQNYDFSLYKPQGLGRYSFLINNTDF